MNERIGCDEFADRAAELALGVLTGRERADALAHLEGCDACRERVRQLTTTGEGLLGLLPAVEPPAGFESRVLARIGIPDRQPEVGMPETGMPETGMPDRRIGAPDRRSGAGGADREIGVAGEIGVSGGGPEPGAGRDVPGRARHVRRARRARPARPAQGDQGNQGDRRDQSAGRAWPTRRTLAAAAAVVAIAAAGAGGWALRGGTAHSSPAVAAAPLWTAQLMSATHKSVGEIFYYDSGRPWMYMTVDFPSGSGNATVKCEIEGPNGTYTRVGSFQLNGGYASWGGDADYGKVTGARLVSADGTVLATASFS